MAKASNLTSRQPIRARAASLSSLSFAGLGLSLVRGAARLLGRGKRSESQLRRQDAPLLIGITLLGGALAPVLMLHGLGRLGGVAGALMLNLEAPFTILVAVLIFREHLGRQAQLAAVFIIAGALALTVRAADSQGPATAAVPWLGGAALAGACLCWALDNNMTQRLSLRDRSWHAEMTLEKTFVHKADAYSRQLQHFAAVIEGREAPLCSAVDGLRTLQATLAVAALQRSMSREGWWAQHLFTAEGEGRSTRGAPAGIQRPQAKPTSAGSRNR